MDAQAVSSLARWQATCAAGIVAATLLSGCERDAHPSETHIQVNAPAAHLGASDVYVNIDDGGGVTVRAHDAPLQAVIEKLAKHRGLRVVVEDRLDQRVTVELHSRTLTATLQQLLRGRGFILIGARKTADERQDSTGTLWILSKRSSGSDSPIAVGSVEDPNDELKSFDELTAALADHDSNARLDAVSELGRFDDDQAAIMLASAALHDEQPAVRTEALQAFGRGRADVHRSVFTRALIDRDADVRKAAINALENIGTESSLQTLAIALKDRDASVRATAVDAIGEIGGDAARRLLESALSDESAVVREAATEQLMYALSARAGY